MNATLLSVAAAVARFAYYMLYTLDSHLQTIKADERDEQPQRLHLRKTSPISLLAIMCADYVD